MDTAAHCIELLQERLPVVCSLDEDTSTLIYGDDRLARFSACEADMIVAIGGDGAVLRAAQVAIAYDKPLLGINTGRLGHLCCLQLKELDDLTEERFAQCKTSPRTVLEFELDGKTYHALNDVIIAKEHFGETLELKTWVDGEARKSFRGDGLIIATPTGSTAYNVSAGGPVLDACVPAFVMTAICPHNERISAQVIGDNAKIEVQIVRATNGVACVYADGAACGTVESLFTVKRREKTLSLICK